ncbi:MAG: PEGA domain-containing protein [Thermoanaerobaculia bacterium]
MKRALKFLSLAVGVVAVLSSSPAFARDGHRSGGGSQGGGFHGGGSFRGGSSHRGGSSFRGSFGGGFGRSFGSGSWSRSYRPHRYWNWGYAPLWASYGWYWGWPYDSFDRPYNRVYVNGGYGAQVNHGRYAVVDTDVNPDEAELWLDGKFIGSADDFDGHPDFLYLKPGKYHLEFKLRGHEGYTVDVEAHRGQTIQIDKKLARAPGVGRLDSFAEPRKGTPFGRVFGSGGTQVTGNEGWRSRHSDRRKIEEDSVRVEAEGDDDTMDGEDAEMESGTDGMSGANGHKVERREVIEERHTDERRMEKPRARAESSRTRFRWNVKPEDAAIYLDDRYLGTGEDLGDARRAFVTEPGKHTVTVMRPGFKTKSIEIEARAGAAVDVAIDLEK